MAIGSGQWFIVSLFAATPLLVWFPVEIALGGLGFVIPWDSISLLGAAGESGSSLTFFAGILALAVLPPIGLATDRLRIPPRAALYWTLFVVLGGVSILWATDEGVIHDRMHTALPLLALYLAATAFCFTRRELLGVFACTISGAFLSSVYALRNAPDGIGRISLVFSSSVTDPNQFANLMLLAISLSFGMLLAFQHTWVRIVVGTALAVILYSVFMTMSRGALIALGTIIVVYLVRMRANRRIVIPVALASSLLLLLPGIFFARLQHSIAGRGAGRFDIWTAGLYALKDNFLYGAGLDNFPVIYQRYAGYAPTYWGYYRAPHNIYLGVSVELGILGITLLLLAFGSQLRDAHLALKASRQFDWIIPLEAACWAMLVDGMSLDILWRKSFWLTWMLLAATVRLHNAENAQKLFRTPVLHSERLRPWTTV